MSDVSRALEVWRESVTLQREAADATVHAQSRAREAVRILRASGLTQRETAATLGVSPQRISQIEQHRDKD